MIRGRRCEDDRAAQRSDAVAAVTGVLEDLQSALDRRAAGEGVGDVGETVLVERTSDQHAGRHRDGRRDDRRHQVPQSSGDAADAGADQRTDDREPDDAGRHVGLAPQWIGMRVRNWMAASRLSRTTPRTSGPR